MQNTNIEIQKVPVGPLGIISTRGSMELADKINDHIIEIRKIIPGVNDHEVQYPFYLRDTYLVNSNCIRFCSGEGKVVINETIRGYDLYIISDIGNYNCKYKMFGEESAMSPDDHFQDIKRVISAVGGKAKRINLIMPLLYGGRQHKRTSRESLDCAIALQELERLGVDNILTFDAHDPRVQNAIPIIGFENIFPTYQIIKALLKAQPDIEINKDKMLIISPDEGGMSRNVYYANVLGLNLGMFYKRRDLTRIVNGKNPIVKHEFLGDSVEGKDVLIVDDMISSGDSIVDIAKKMKEMRAKRVFVAVTFALFTEGIETFNKMYEEGLIDRVFSTNLTYRSQELLNAPWYYEVDVSKFIALLIDTLNDDQSLSSLLNPSAKIHRLLDNRKL